ncbi:MAG TPA: DsbE family thiol:disulfide interchange protein [Stellaceae bacterium]|nr:DsbE family thiol:disulfide interchange protein [Stellaceae bacterium]
MRRLIYLLPVLAFTALVGYFFLALQRDPSILPSAMIDKPAPAFDLAGVAGAPGFARADAAGQVVLVNFFASWCVPCRLEHPLLMQLSHQLKVPLYGIDYKDKPEDATRFLQEFGDPYKRIGADRDGRVGIDFGVYGVPETYVIDKAGRIRLRHVGPLTPDDVQNELIPLLRTLQTS